MLFIRALISNYILQVHKYRVFSITRYLNRSRKLKNASKMLRWKFCLSKFLLYRLCNRYSVCSQLHVILNHWSITDSKRSVCLSVCLPVCLSVYLSVCLSLIIQRFLYVLGKQRLFTHRIPLILFFVLTQFKLRPLLRVKRE